MNRIQSCSLAVLAAISVHAGFVTPAASAWKLGRYASCTGDIVVVDIPAGRADTGNATLPFDFSQFKGRPFEATIRARGFRLSKPPETWLGFKFMGTFRCAEDGQNRYPGAPQKLGDFDWQTVRLVDTAAGVTRSPGLITLGIQAATGRVEFDVSTFRARILPPMWPETNLVHTCVYTPRVKDLSVHRGVMLGHKLKEPDFRTLHDWGVTLARFQMTRGWNTPGANRDLADYDRYIDGELDELESELVWARKYGIKVVVDLHAAPGARDENHDLHMCHDAVYADHFVKTWRRIASRFKGRPEIFGFDLVNEPQQLTPALPGCDYWSIQSRAAEAIREVDPETPVIIESNCYDSPQPFTYMYPLNLTNIIYQVHMYVPMEFTHQGVFDKKGPATKWPDPAKKWDIDLIRKTLKPVMDFQKRHGARIYVGEFSAIVWGEGADNYIRDCISVFEENGWDWTFHAFREWSGWSVEHVAPQVWKMVPSDDNPRKRALLDGFRRNARARAAPVPCRIQ